MEILSKQKDELLSGSEVWLVRPDGIDDVFRVCVTPSRNNPPAGKRFGVVMATDAELSAGALISTIRSASIGFDLPFLYAVSVGYPLDAQPPFALRRNRDLTPTRWPLFEAATPALTGLPDRMPTGGSERFAHFLAEELLPALAEAFPIDPQDATLAGQSFGGLFVLDTLLRQPARFRRYLAVSPSIWWDGGFLLHQAGEMTRTTPSPSGHVYMCVGELENRARFGAQIAQLPDAMQALVPADMKRLDMAGDMFMMEQLLQRWKGDGFSVEAHVFPEESHESIMGSALSRGLRRLYAR
jgi:predicted alpha/beta superfamily hydrolase